MDAAVFFSLLARRKGLANLATDQNRALLLPRPGAQKAPGAQLSSPAAKPALLAPSRSENMQAEFHQASVLASLAAGAALALFMCRLRRPNPDRSVQLTSPYPLRCSRAARGHPAAAGGRGAARRPNRRGPRATPPGSWWWKSGSPSVPSSSLPSTTLGPAPPLCVFGTWKGARKVALDCFLLPGSRASGRCCTPVYSAVALRARPTRVDAVTAVRLAPHRLRAFLSPVSISSPRQQQHVDSSPRQQQHVNSSPRQQHVETRRPDSSPSTRRPDRSSSSTRRQDQHKAHAPSPFRGIFLLQTSPLPCGSQR